jgi:RES domain-containing protein
VRLYRFGSDPLREPEEEFNGQGGVLSSGRWHIKARAAVYTATTEPLALLEKLIHRKRGSTVPAYPLYIAEIPDILVEELSASLLPHDWRSIYPPRSTQELGDQWLKSLSGIGLLVPSVLISGIEPLVKNCLVNPLHPEFNRASVSGPILFAVDPRFPSP